MITFEEVLLRLQRFWSDHDCIIWQPYNVQVGAGTMNPATYLKVLGPEPWNVGYVEPVVRPDDGRYGENPNRMQYYYQYQVILKPDPGNPQEIYLESLKALGIDRDEHDIRFVEDNWESPALGAWGLGWEVWLDGLEITQYTYFQQAGGMALDPVSVEITYGVERIVMALQGVESVWDIQFNKGMTYADIYLAPEREHSTYYFELADEEQLVDVYNTYEQEAINALEHDPPLVMPAHDYVLKCSHIFNVLDTRGAIGVVERADYFRRMQRLAARVAQEYVAQRGDMGYPLLPEGWQVDEETGDLTRPDAPTPDIKTGRYPRSAAPFLLEIGTEELPAQDVDVAAAQLADLVPQMLSENRLDYETVVVGATPRRLVVSIEGLAPKQPAQELIKRGPPAKIAYDDDGSPTKAAEGFARSIGVDPADLERMEVDGGEYVGATIQDEGRQTKELLPEVLPDLLGQIRFNRSMRWNESGVAFSRPIRWLVGLYGKAIVPFSYAGVHSGRTTRGTRPAGSPEIEIESVDAYFDQIRDQQIIINLAERHEVIREQVTTLAESAGGQIYEDDALLGEVTNLVEHPTAVLGQFEERFLELPAPILMTVMRKHQRYFAVVDEKGDLMPLFITVRNGDDQHVDKVAAGNEAVIRARFTDAVFFYEEDTKKPLEAYVEDLKTLTFQESLGSYFEKAARLEGLAGRVGAALDMGDTALDHTIRAAHLSKADLVTQMVVEMTSLQGTMGRIYALEAGEPEPVAQAIEAHYLPRYAGDDLPQSDPGLALALADRLDSLVGLFAVGMAPTGTSDPYGLRRAAVGLVQILMENEIDVDLRTWLKWAAQGYTQELGETFVTEESIQNVLDFIIDRMRVILRDEFRHDVVEAVLGAVGHNPYRADLHAEQLSNWVQIDEWEETLDTYARCVRITRNHEQLYEIDEDALGEVVEKELWIGYQQAAEKIGPEADVDAFFDTFEPLIPAIQAFFAPEDEGGVLVMADDETTRHNRLGILQRIAALTDGIVDLRQMEGF